MPPKRLSAFRARLYTVAPAKGLATSPTAVPVGSGTVGGGPGSGPLRSHLHRPGED